MHHAAFRVVARTLAACLLIGTLGWLVFKPRPSLDGLDRLLAAGQFKAAEVQLVEYLRASPTDAAARIILARASVNRPDPKPDFALEQLASLRPASDRLAAQVEAIRGQAFFLQGRYDRAETAWLEALRLEPRTAEVGWGLLNIYAWQGRGDDSNRLALRLFAAEPDEHDRLQLLLQTIRFNAHAIETGSIVAQLEPVVRANPEDVASSLALGTALVREGRGEAGLTLIRKVVQAQPDATAPWLHLFEALAATGQVDELSEALAKAPLPTRPSPGTLAARGWLATQRQEWGPAADCFLEAFRLRPADPSIAYRLKTALHHAGREDDLARLGPSIQAAIEFNDKICLLYDRIDAGPDLNMGGAPDAIRAFGEGTPADLYHRVASILRPVGRVEEADHWDDFARSTPRDGR